MNNKLLAVGAALLIAASVLALFAVIAAVTAP